MAYLSSWFALLKIKIDKARKALRILFFFMAERLDFFKQLFSSYEFRLLDSDFTHDIYNNNVCNNPFMKKKIKQQ